MKPDFVKQAKEAITLLEKQKQKLFETDIWDAMFLFNIGNARFGICNDPDTIYKTIQKIKDEIYYKYSPSYPNGPRAKDSVIGWWSFVPKSEKIRANDYKEISLTLDGYVAPNSSWVFLKPANFNLECGKNNLSVSDMLKKCEFRTPDSIFLRRDYENEKEVIFVRCGDEKYFFNKMDVSVILGETGLKNPKIMIGNIGVKEVDIVFLCFFDRSNKCAGLTTRLTNYMENRILEGK